MKIVNVWLFALLLTIFARSTISAEYVAGDLAPRGAPDGVLNVADLLVMLKIYQGVDVPTSLESLVGDVAPIGNPDGQIDVKDILVLQRAINGDVTLNPVIVLPPSPALNPVSSPVNQDTVVISGTAQNNATVRIYNNGSLVDTLISSVSDGSFSTSITLTPGINNIHATEWDGISESENSNTVSVEYVLPVPVLDTVPATTTLNGITVTGTVPAGDFVKLFVNGVEFAQANIIAGSFQFDNVVLNIGSNSIYAIASTGGMDGAQSTAVSIDYSFTTPTISDPGNSANANPYTINGSADANTAVRIYLNGDYQQTVTSDVLGIFSADVYLTHGSNSIVAKAWDGYIETVASNTIAASYTDSTPRNLNQTGIGSDTVWTPGPTNAPYVITRYFIIPSGVTLTIMPGTRIEYNATTENIGLQVQGTLTVLGSASDPVVFTSAEAVPAPGDWPGIMFTGTSVNSDIMHATFEYARNAVWAWSNGEVNVHDSTFTRFSNAGVYTDSNSSGVVDSNTFDNIDQLPTGSISVTTIGSAVQLRSSNFVVSNNQVTRTNLGIFQTGGTSTISGNDFSNMPTAIWLYQSGNSTINQGNVFTGLDIGIYMTGDTVGGTNPQTVIRNNAFIGNFALNMLADDFVNGAADLVDATHNWWDDTDPRGIIQTIADSQGGTFYILSNPPTINYGSYLDAEGGQPVYDNWLFEDITVSTTLNAGERYEVFRNINVSSAATLTIPAGTELHFVYNDGLTLDGSLDVQGTSQQPVVFTSNANSPSAGSWQGIAVNDPASIVNIDHAQITYASNALHFLAGQANVMNSDLGQNLVALQYEAGVTGSIDSSVIANNGTGIRLNGASPDIIANTIQGQTFGIYLTQGASPVIDNGNIISGNNYGIYSLGDGALLANNPVPVINSNSIHSNTNYNLYTSNYVSADSTVIDARENWWGIGNAISVSATIYDHGDIASSPFVDYGRYLDQQGGVPVYQNSLIGTVVSNLDILQGEIYEVIGDLTIESGVTVNMAAGSQLSFPGNSQLIVNGALTATGTSGNHVIMTSTEGTPAAGSWQGISVGPGGNLVLDYVSIQYADRGIDFQSASGSINNTDISDSIYGVYISASSPTVTASAIHDNTYGIYVVGLSDPVINNNNDISLNQYGLYVVGGSAVADENPDPTVTGNAIHQNSSSNFYADSFYNANGLMLNATGNYWGDPDPLVIQATIRDYMDDNIDTPFVDYGHYLDSAGGSVVKQNYLLGYVSGIKSDTSDSYEVLADVFVGQGQTLELQQGVQLEFLANYQLIVDGTLLAQGAAGNPVLFTTGESAKNIGDWQGILVNATSTGTVIDYVEIEYALYGIEFNGASGTVTHSNLHNNSRAIYVTGANANPVINNQNTIVNNTYGVYVEGQAMAGTNPNPVVNGNTIHSNSSYNYQAVNFYQPALTVLDATNNWWNLVTANEIAATIQDQTDQASSPYVNYGQYLDAQNGVPVYANSLLGPVSGTIDTSSGTDYELLGNVVVPSGQSLTIAAGVNLLAVDNVTFNVDGNLYIQGTEPSPVHISSNSTSPGAWNGIYINSTSATVNIDWAHIENADYGLHFNNSGASGLVTHSVIENNVRGINIYGISSPTVNTGNLIRSNQYGVYLEGTGVTGEYPAPAINDNQIYGNTTYNVYTNTFVDSNYPVVDATSNYWGSSDVNTIATGIYDVGDSTASRPIVDYSGYYHIPGAQPDARQFLLIGKVNQNTTLAADSSYLVPYNLIVEAGSTLTIEQGVELYFTNNKGITVHGALDINGVSTNRVVLTSANQFLGYTQYPWSGIRVENDPGSINIDYAVVSHASYALYFNEASGSVTNTIFNNNQYAIYIINNSAPIIDSNSIVENRYGIYIGGYLVDPNPNISNNDIYGNIYANLYLDSIDTTTILNIGNNWWGTDVVADIRNTITVTGGSDQTMSVLLDAIALQLNQVAIPVGIAVSEQYISPAESIGVQDSVNLTASLGQASAWAVDVVNSAGQSVRNYTGSGTSINISWDGQDGGSLNVADGAYAFVISVASTPVKQVRSVVVDNLLPSASFMAGLGGSTIDASSITIQGTATDNFFQNYQVEHGVGPAPSSWTLIDGVKTTQVLSGNLVDWMLNSTSGLAPPPNGTTTLRLTVTDLAGNSSIQTVQVTLNTLAIYSVSHDITTIHPVQGEMTTISFSLNNPATVTMQIAAESDGTVVRSISQNFTASGSYGLVWDGKDDTDSHVQNDAYIYTLVADDGARQASYSPAYTPYVGSISGSSLIGYSISKNKFWKNNTSVGVTGRVRLCIGTNTSPPSAACNGTGHFAAIDDVPYQAGSHWLYWNGRLLNGDALKSKLYRFFLSVPHTLPPNTIIVKGNTPYLQGEAAVPPNIEIRPNTYKVRHSYDEFSVINYEVDQDSYVTIKMLPPGINDPTDPSAITILNNQLQAAESSPGVPLVHSFDWRGYDDSVPTPDTNNILVSTNGRYTFTIEATSVVTGFSTLYRGSLRLYH